MTSPPGYYGAVGDPLGTVRYWDGGQWTSEPMPPPPGWGTTEATVDARFARFWIRYAALFLDGTISMVVMAPIYIPWFIDLFDEAERRQTTGDTSLMFDTTVPSQLVVAGLVVSVIHLVMIALVGGTPGKLLVGLRITSEDGASTPPGFNRAARRMLPTFVGAIPVIGAVVGIGIAVASAIWVNTDSERRSAYDRIAGTRVVYKNRL